MPDEHSLIRYIPWSKLRKDADDNVCGVLSVAFRLREGEEYLSATWLEHFGEQVPANLHLAVAAIRNSMNVGAKSGFALGIAKMIGDGSERCNCKIRIVHEPEDTNTGHTAVRRWPTDNQDLFDLMADEVWNTLHLNAAIP